MASRAKGTLGRLTDEAGGIYHRLANLERSGPAVHAEALARIGREIDSLRSQLTETRIAILKKEGVA